MSGEKIRTKHPEGKHGVNISKAKYETIRKAVVASFRKHGELTFTELAAAVEKKLKGQFQGVIPWYVITVQKDLEARRMIARIPKTRPQKLRLI